MRKRFGWLGLVVTATVVGAFVWMRESSGKTTIRQKTTGEASALARSAIARNATPQAAGASFAAVTNQTPTVRGTLPYVLTSVKPFDESVRLAAEATGAKTVCILDRNTALVEADAATRARLSADRRFRKVTEFSPADKVQSDLAALIAGGAEAVDVAIISLSAADRQVVRACLESGGGEMLKGCINEGSTLRARLPAALVATLAGRGDVRWMERFERPQLMNDIAVNPPGMNVREVWDAHGLTGKGQIISTSDSGIDTGDFTTMHADLRNRVKEIQVVDDPPCVSYDPIGHGTHTAGSIVGDGTMSQGKIRGTAHEADLYAWFCSDGDNGVCTPTTLFSLYTNDGQWDAHIHSASWGSNSGGRYTATCMNNDEYLWNHPEFLPVYSAGNSGSGRQTIGSPAASKNVLAVGATQNARTGHDGGSGNGNPKLTVKFSSRGPCRDGRIKPDIASPGTGILSTRAHGIDYSYGNYDEFYAYDSGTSMACPLTAGAVALVRQWLVEQKGFEDVDGKRPTAALMKAVITGGAKDAPVPNNDQGWGRVDLAETLFPTGGRDVKLVDRIPFAADEVFEYLIETTNAAPLDVQLCWVDYPGSASGSDATPRLVNDLDLTVESLDGASGVMLGNGGSSPDTVNNMESVRLATAEPGKYLITVTCSHIPYNWESGGAAALYVRGAFDPAAEPTGLDRARIRRLPDVTYTALDKALKDVQDGDVVEVLDTVALRRPMTLTNSITICATNETSPAATPVKANGRLTIGNDVRVFFTNVVFTGASPVLSVSSNACVALAGKVGLDRIVLDKDAQLEVAGLLSDDYAYRIVPGKGHSLIGETFGRASVDLETAQSHANYFVNAYDGELVGEAVDDGKGGVSLRWAKGVVPEAAAVARLIQDGQAVWYADMKVLLKYVTNDAEIVVLKTCPTEGVLKTGAHKLTIRSDNGAVLTPEVLLDGSEGTNAFVVSAGGSLTVSNVVFSGFSQLGNAEAFIVVEPNGFFRMLDGSALRDIVNITPYGSKKSYGAVMVFGAMSMTNGTHIVGCAADGGSGGGIYLQKGGVLDFCGAEVTGCWATEAGGGVYVEAGAEMNLSGVARITQNERRSKYDTWKGVADDLYVCDNIPETALPLNVSRVARGAQVGVCSASYNESSPRGQVLGLAFANLRGAMDETTAAQFFNDIFNGYSDGLVGSVSETGDRLVWADKDVKPNTVPKKDATVQVEIGGVTNFYKQLSHAFISVEEDEAAVVTLLQSVPLDADIDVKGVVTLDGAGYWVYQVTPDEERYENRFIRVSGTERTLCLTNVTFTGYDESLEGYYAYGTLLTALDGASLTLEKDAWVVSVVESDEEEYWPSAYDLESTPAVNVEGGARLTMKSGSAVMRCRNDADLDNTIVGGGIAVTGVGTVFQFEGGTVSGCNALHGGGVIVRNGARMLVSGDAKIENNENFDGEADDLYASDGRCVVLTGLFTGKIGHTLGVTKANSETNVFGTVAADCPIPLPNLVPSAANFYKDADRGVTGCIVTNETESLLVWSSAVSAEGLFSDAGGNVYGLVKGVTPKLDVTNAVPTAVTGLVYNGQAQTGVVESVGFMLTGNVATNAGSYTATAVLTNGVWEGGSTEPTNITWSIAKATYDMGGVTFTNETYAHDGTVRSLAVAGNLPAGVSVSYEGNGQSEIGVYTVTAKFTGDKLNYNPIPDKTATLTIVKKDDPPEPPEPGPGEVVNPTPIAFKSIIRLSETEWALVVTDRVEHCRYRLLTTDDLTKGFVTTGEWATAEADGPWETNVTTSVGQRFWKAEATSGEVPADE